MLLDRCALQQPKADLGRFNSHILLYCIFLMYVSARRTKTALVNTNQGVFFCKPKLTGKWVEMGTTTIKLPVINFVALGVFLAGAYKLGFALDPVFLPF